MDNHQLVNQTSGNTEWYTPPELVEAARRVMGIIHFDPASSLEADAAIVKAGLICTQPSFEIVGNIKGLPVRRNHDGGLDVRWFGHVWLNHPFGNSEKKCSPNCIKTICLKRGWHTAVDIPGNKEWIAYAVRQYEGGNVQQACILTYAATSEVWFKPLKDYPMCLIDGRVNYLDPATMQPVKGVTKGSVVTYLGPHVYRFVEEFDKFGAVMVRVRPLPPALETTLTAVRGLVAYRDRVRAIGFQIDQIRTAVTEEDIE